MPGREQGDGKTNRNGRLLDSSINMARFPDAFCGNITQLSRSRICTYRLAPSRLSLLLERRNEFYELSCVTDETCELPLVPNPSDSYITLTPTAEDERLTPEISVTAICYTRRGPSSLSPPIAISPELA